MSILRHRARLLKTVDVGIWPLLTVVLVVSIYPLLRYSGWWNPGNDTLNFTAYIRNVWDVGQLVPERFQIYASGYGFQALSVFLLELGGFDLPEWQLYGALLLITWVVFPAWLLYREWVGSNYGAALATVFLFMQPEFLFGIMRGTHEKFTRGLILLCLYLLTYSLRSRHDPRRFTAAVFAFYLVMYALITFNNLFATSFIAAVLLALCMTWIAARWTRSLDSFSITLRRLAYVVAAASVLAFLYTFYVYSPAMLNLFTLQTIPDRITALLLGSEQATAFNPYADPVFHAWTSPHVFLLLTLPNWLLLFVSGLIWGVQSVRWIRNRRGPSSDSELLLWAFYGAFTMQGALAILADVSGVLTGNLQHRIFPTIGLVAAPLIARWLLSILQTKQQPVARRIRTGLWIGIGILSLLALFKATNEPVFSNQLANYLPAEVRALDWAERSLAERPVWTGFDRRLVEVIHIHSGGTPRRMMFDALEAEPGTKDFLVSDIIRLQVPRLGVILPTESDDLVTFDNGQAQIYHRRPDTPYHR